MPVTSRGGKWAEKIPSTGLNRRVAIAITNQAVQAFKRVSPDHYNSLPVLLYDFLYKKAWFVVAVHEDIAIPLFFSRKIHVYLRFNEYAN